jgi:hypothetical protein
MAMTTIRIRFWPLAAGLCLAPSVASAAEKGQFLNAPVSSASPAPRLAVQYELKLRLPEGRGLARLLLDAGVNSEDAGAAARLAAGHLGDGLGGCDVKVAISRSVGDRGYRLDRVTLFTLGDQTVIERRRGELTIASTTPISPRIRILA